DQAGDGEPPAEASRPDGQRALVELLDQPCQPGSRVTRLAERTDRDAAAVGEECLQVGLKAHGAREQLIANAERRGRDSVENERADVSGEEVRVGLAEKRSVTEPQVGE